LRAPAQENPGQALSGRALVTFAATIVDAVNRGAIPVLRDAFASAAFEQLTRAKEDSTLLWETQKKGLLREALQEGPAQAARCADAARALLRRADQAMPCRI